MDVSKCKPFFALTAKEVEIVKGSLEIAEKKAASIIKAIRGEEVSLPKNARTELLTRIKQWQDEKRIDS